MKYGSTVVLLIGDQRLNALVLQSQAVGDEEHLTVAYLDPKQTDVPILGGQQTRAAVQFGYSVAPWKTGQHTGWKASIPETPNEVTFTVPFSDMLDLSHEIIKNNLGSDLEVSPDATVRSAIALIGRLSRYVATHPESDTAELEQLRVQLAGCLTAAEGSTKNIAAPSDFGWSPAYQAVLDLRNKYEDLMDKVAGVPDEANVPSELTADDAATLKVLSGSGGLAGQVNVDNAMDAGSAPQTSGLVEIEPAPTPADVDAAVQAQEKTEEQPEPPQTV